MQNDEYYNDLSVEIFYNKYNSKQNAVLRDTYFQIDVHYVRNVRIFQIVCESFLNYSNVRGNKRHTRLAEYFAGSCNNLCNN